MTKTIEEHFRDWESDAIGYGYGSGEEHTIPALRRFLELCMAKNGQYDFTVLEAHLTPTVAWLLISILCKADVIEYGTSPRFGWLTKKGERLQAFMLSRPADELVEIACGRSEYDNVCYPDHCNCDEGGDPPLCGNPFWFDPA